MSELLNSRLHEQLVQGAVVLTPNDRLARRCRVEYERLCIDQGRRAWETPQILPITSWISMLYRELQAHALVDRCLLTDEQAQVLWKTVIEQSTPDALLSINATVNAVSTAWELEHLYADDTRPDTLPLSDDQQHYLHWKQRFKQICSEGNWIDQAAITRHLIEHLRDWPASLPRQYLLLGFTEPAPSVLQLFHCLDSLGVEHWQVDTEAGNAVRVDVIASHDDEQELLSCARWARHLFEQQSHDEGAGLIGVVIPDLHARRDQILRVFDGVFFPAATPTQINELNRPYDLSLGSPLSRYALVDHALLLLRLTFGELQSSDLTRVLLSPFIVGAESERDRRAELDVCLRREHRRTVSLNVLRRHRQTPAILREVLQKIRSGLRRDEVTPSVWLDRFVALLETCGWPGDQNLDSVEYQTVEAWKRELESLYALDSVMGSITWQSMLGLLRQHTERRIFQPQSAEVPIWILGALESQGLKFSHLRVLGMDNESWPPSLAPSPYLPLQWQKRVGIPGASPVLDAQLAARQLREWAARTETLVLSHVLHRNGNTIDCSPLIADVVPSAVATNGQVETVQSPAPAAIDLIADELRLSTEQDVAGPGLPTGTRVKGGARLLEDQAHCPFRAFAIHRLATRELEEPGLGVDPRDKGNLFHHTVEHFWERVQSQQQLLALDDSALMQHIDEALERAFNAVAVSSPELRQLERLRIRRSVRRWLEEHESQRDAFTVIALEASDEYAIGPLRLKLTVDRVDQLDEGGRVIIDYKTGAGNSVASWKKERITSPQLPLYAVLQEESVAAVCFAQVAVNSQRFIGMGSEAGVLPRVEAPDNEGQSWQQQLEDWRHSLLQLATEVQTGVASVTPGKTACQFCALPALCRIEQTVIEAAGEAAGQDQESAG